MRRTSLILLVMILSACGDEPPVSAPPPTTAPSPTPTTPSPTAGEEPSAEETSYVVLPEVGEVAIASACQTERRNESILLADLANGGQLQLRKLAGGDLHASALPAPDADPVGTREPSDSDWTESGGWLSGTSLMWLEGTENRITVEYHVRWDETVPPC